TDNNEAYLLYLEGRHYWNQRGEGVSKSIEQFNAAIKLDPNFALAYVGLADAYNLLGFYGFMRPQEALQKSIDLLASALSRDNSLAEAHATLADIKYMYELDWAGAEYEFKRAFDLNPHYSTARQWYSEYLAARGRLDDALQE